MPTFNIKINGAANKKDSALGYSSNRSGAKKEASKPLEQ
ncbi:MAG: hypothetical protein OP8BY_1137 [Candidatus Saccharicenans subterraneus]|uniref:Uncharacterized protein n=1 Tax=Candidatus Saccharicenans subterraneus TaxID=2508984 RepID=A0A3E2BK64_9BACT|nr:MAG: hypothetical protein OP8BY_1137 [Candidatus Saccharicenans subterraneum]